MSWHQSITHSLDPTQITRQRLTIGTLAVGAVVLVAYFSALRVSFVGDDWIFYEFAGRLNLADYLVKYFDPRVQTAWYRPVQGVLFRIGYDVFGPDQLWYHLVNVLVHLWNSMLLFALVARTLKNYRVGLIAGLLFATFPIAVEGVFKAGVIDPVTALFTLLAIWFWLRHLEGGRARDYWLAFGMFLLALFSKEIAVTLPVTLFLFDRCLSARPATARQLFRRYVWFVIAWIGYAPIEFIVVQRSVFVHHEGYLPRLNLVMNLVDYLAGLAFPWRFVPPLSHACLAAGIVALAYFILVRNVRGLIPIAVGAMLYVLPIVLFPEVSLRFDYASLTASAVLLALLCELVLSHPKSPIVLRGVTCAVVGLLVVFGAAEVSRAAAEFGEYGRVSRIPFRNVRQAHPTLPDDTLVYFIHPPVPGPNLSGMFFWYYGTRVHVAADDAQFRAHLRDYPVAYVNYFDDQGNQKEQKVERETTQSRPALPARFELPVQLDSYELVTAQPRRDQALVILLYWRALGPIAEDYTVFVHLVDGHGAVVAGYDKEPRRGDAPTSAWVSDERVADAVQLPLPSSLAAGSYYLEVGLYNAASGQRVGIVDSTGQTATDHVRIEPLSVIE